MAKAKPSTAVAVRAASTEVISRDDIVESRLWPNINSPERAAVVLAMARNHDMDPCFVAANIAFIGGKPAASGLYLAAVLKKTRRYRYRRDEKLSSDGPNTKCVLRWLEKVDGTWEEVGTTSFSLEDAKRAELLSNQTWKKYPARMCFWRALSAGAREYCPDAIAGGCTHLIEELVPDAAYDNETLQPVVTVTGVEIDTDEEVDASHPHTAALREQVRQLAKDTATPMAKVEERLGGPLLLLPAAALEEGVKLLRVKQEAMAMAPAERGKK
jgi:hypothetical protein